MGGGGTKTREFVRRGCNEESWWWERCGGGQVWNLGMWGEGGKLFVCFAR